MKKLKILFAMLLATIAVSITAVFAACGKGSDPSLSLSDEELSLYVGETHTLTVEVTEINENLSWVSSDEAVIKIEPSDDGKSAVVTSLQAGNADITVSASGITATCSVTSNDITDINSIEIRYDGSSTPVLKQGDSLSANKLTAQVSGVTLDYRYTVKFGNGAESELNTTYTLAEKGTYIVTAYVTTRGYAGSDKLEIKVADELTDLTINCNLSDTVFVNSVLKTTDVSCSSASVSSLEFGYNVTFPNGSKKAFDKDLTLSQAGDYIIEAYIKNNSEWFGTATKTVNVKEKISLTDKMSLTYNEADAENGEHDISSPFDFSKFALDITNRPSEVTDENIVWKLNDEDFNPASQSSYTFNSVGKYVLTVSINHENYSGEKSVEIVVYKNHTVTLTGSETAIIDKAFTYSYSATQGIELRLEVSYDNGETYSLYNGTFTQLGNATIRAKVVDANNYNRGEATKNIIVYAIGSALDVKNELVTLHMGITQTVSGSAVSNLNTLNAAVNGASNVTYFATNEVVTISGSTVTGANSGVAEVYALTGGAAYLAYTVTVKDYTGYKAIATLADLKAVGNDVNGKYLMVDDIDLGGVAGQIANAFSGIFDGNGHAVKNGYINMATNAGEAKRDFIGALGGTLKNTAFIGWKTESGTNGTWQGAGILSNMEDNATVENLYIEMTVNGNGQNNCNGVLTASATGKNITIRNIITNVTYTGKYNFGTITGGNPDCLKNANANVFALVGEYKDKIPCTLDNPKNKSLNYTDLAELKAAKPELFADGGVFTGEFWEKNIMDVNRPVLKTQTIDIFEGETFTDNDIFVKNRIALTSSQTVITYSDGTYVVGEVDEETEVTLTATYDGKEIKLTVTVKPITDITGSGELKFIGGTPYKMGDAVNASDFEATYNSNSVTVTDFKILKDGSEVSTFDGEGTYTVTATVTERGYKGTLSCNIEIKRPVSVTCDKENADLTLYPTQTVSGSAYSDTTKSTVQLTVTASYTDEQGGAATITGYVSKNESVATVNASGLVTAVAGGTAEIFAVVNGQEYKVCTVTVTSYADYKAIATLADLKAVGNDVYGKYLMVDDIDLNYQVGQISGSFYGIFDGNGHAVKNGFINMATNTGEKDRTFMSELAGSGTLKNTAFLGWKTETGTNSSWQGAGILANIKENGTAENLYIEMTVNGTGTNNCNGVLSGNTNGNNITIRNIITNVTYTGEYNFGTITGGNPALENVYALVGEYKDKIPCTLNNPNNKSLNYTDLAELKAAKPELFADDGVFATDFWKEIVESLEQA